MGFLGGTSGKKPPANARDIETQDRSLGWEDLGIAGHGKPLQYSCLETSMDMDFLSLMGFSALGSKELGMTEWLTHTHTHAYIYIFSLLPIALNRISSTMLNRNNKSGHFCLLPDVEHSAFPH